MLLYNYDQECPFCRKLKATHKWSCVSPYYKPDVDDTCYICESCNKLISSRVAYPADYLFKGPIDYNVLVTYFEYHTADYETNVLFKLLHIVPAEEIYHLIHCDGMSHRTANYSAKEINYWRFDKAMKALMIAIEKLQVDEDMVGCGVYGDDLRFVIKGTAIYELDFNTYTLSKISSRSLDESMYRVLFLKRGDGSLVLAKDRDNPIICNMIRILNFYGYSIWRAQGNYDC